MSAPALFLGSSMVEHSAVNRVVVGSSPTQGANKIKRAVWYSRTVRAEASTLITLLAIRFICRTASSANSPDLGFALVPCCGGLWILRHFAAPIRLGRGAARSLVAIQLSKNTGAGPKNTTPARVRRTYCGIVEWHPVGSFCNIFCHEPCRGDLRPPVLTSILRCLHGMRHSPRW